MSAGDMEGSGQLAASSASHGTSKVGFGGDAQNDRNEPKAANQRAPSGKQKRQANARPIRIFCTSEVPS